MVLPTLIVGNELLILAGVAAAVGRWFFAHRHGQLRGLVDAGEAEAAAVVSKAQGPKIPTKSYHTYHIKRGLVRSYAKSQESTKRDCAP